MSSLVPVGAAVLLGGTPVMPEADQFPSYKPSAWYFREALRNAQTRDEALEVGLQVVLEVEALKEWIRDRGMIPPKSFIMESEAREKGWPIQETLRFEPEA